MPAPSSLWEQVLALPSGPGGVHGLGETFAADPYTGTGRYRVPIPVPEGHGGLKPELALVYSSGAGNGVCGVGWSFSAGLVRRRLEKGIPRYRDDDRFVLGDDELVPRGAGTSCCGRRDCSRGSAMSTTRGGISGLVTDRSGVRRLYGASADDRDGDSDAGYRVASLEIRDTSGNAVTFSYERDVHGARAYLTQVDWGRARSGWYWSTRSGPT